MKILVLSPHRGDAAFSLSLAITGWLKARHTVTILNVFTRSLQAPFSDAEFVHENDRLSYVSAMRLREDEVFVQRLTQDLPRSAKGNLQMVDLNLKDAPIRLRCPLEEVCDRPVNPDDPAIEKIRRALERQAEAGAMEALVLPLALGEHVDHLTVRAAAFDPHTQSAERLLRGPALCDDSSQRRGRSVRSPRGGRQPVERAACTCRLPDRLSPWR